MGSVFEDSLRSFLEPINPYLDDEKISEVMINGYQEIWVEQKGKLIQTKASFKDEGHLMAAARNIAQYVNRPLDQEHLTLDARLPDGSRIHVVIPPCARNGTTISIRKFSKSKLTMKNLIDFKAISEDAARFLDIVVYLKKNLIVSGGTGSGKTTLLNVLGTRIPAGQRILIIEDASELQVHSDHVVYFETKACDENGKGEVTIRDLIKSSLRLRPDRVIVGEVRGGEAFDLLQAMSTGHGGSMGTVHANTPKETLTRLETLTMMSGIDIPITAIRLQVASSINVICQIARLSDGSRRITHISESIGVDTEGRYQTNDIYVFKQTDKLVDGTVVGEMLPTGNIPSFMSEIELNKIPFPRSKFKRIEIH